MIEKATIATLIATFLAVGYSGIEDSIESVYQEANAVSALMQEKELKNALEIYYLEHDSYPMSYNEGMVEELYEYNCLETPTVPVDLEYTPSHSGQTYSLTIL